MKIDVRCEGCGQAYRLDAQHAGKRMRCKGCGHKITIPAPSAAADPVDDDLIPLAPAAADPLPAQVPWARVAPATVTTPTFDLDEAPAPPPLPSGAAFPPRAPVPVVALEDDGADAYVGISHEAAVDRFLPFAIVGLFLLVLIVLAARGVSQAVTTGRDYGASAELVSQAVGRAIGFSIGLAAGIAGIATPLCLLGVFVASKVMRFPNRPRLYWRCLAVMCAPTALAGTFGLLFGIAPGDAAVPWFFGVPVLIVTLWFMLRLRPGPFAATTGFVLLFAVGLPLAIYLAVLTVAGSAGSNATVATAAPVQVPAPANSRPPVPPPGSRERKYSPAKPGEADDPELDESRRKLTGQEKYAMQAVEARMRKVGQAIADYAARHQGKYPNSLGDLANAGLINMNERGESFDRYTYAASSYMKYPGPERMIVLERQYAGYPRRTVLFGDGRVESIEPARWVQVKEASSDAIRKRTAEDTRR